MDANSPQMPQNCLNVVRYEPAHAILSYSSDTGDPWGEKGVFDYSLPCDSLADFYFYFKVQHLRN